MKRTLLAMCVLATVFALNGCGDACSEAISLCEDCELDTSRCEATFDGAPNDFCEAAVQTYEASCE